MLALRVYCSAHRHVGVRIIIIIIITYVCLCVCVSVDGYRTEPDAGAERARERSIDVPCARADNVKKRGRTTDTSPAGPLYSRYTSVNYTQAHTKEPKQTSRPRLLCSRT